MKKLSRLFICSARAATLVCVSHATSPRPPRRAARFHIAHCPLRHRLHAQRWLDERPANQGGIEAPAWTFIVRRRFAHHRSIAFSAARIASRLAPAIEPSSGLGGV